MSGLYIFECREHSSVHVVGQMAMESPKTGIICVESYDYTLTWRNMNCIPQRSGEAPTVNVDDLKTMAMQMHRMRHHGSISHRYLNTLSFAQDEWRT